MASDAELIGRSLAGDGEAFMEVICRHEVAIGAYLERRVGREAAQDLLGDVWVAAFRSREAYDQSFAGARPWLYKMALNRLRHYWRSQPAEDLVPDVTGLATGWDPWPAVDVRVDTQTVLRAAMARLRPEEREVLTLVAGEDLSDGPGDCDRRGAATGIFPGAQPSPRDPGHGGQGRHRRRDRRGRGGSGHRARRHVGDAAARHAGVAARGADRISRRGAHGEFQADVPGRLHQG
jgi:RNA polymerase sigma-70 factor (ECF subfamily)